MVSVVFLIRVYSRQFAAKRFFRFTAITRDVGDYGDLALSHLLPYSQPHAPLYRNPPALYGPRAQADGVGGLTSRDPLRFDLHDEPLFSIPFQT